MTLFDTIPESLPLPARVLADQATREPIQRGWANGADEWKQEAAAVLKALCRRREEFTADDLDELRESARDGRILGGLLKYGESQGWCYPTGRVVPSRARSRNHGRKIAVWRSGIFKPQTD